MKIIILCPIIIMSSLQLWAQPYGENIKLHSTDTTTVYVHSLHLLSDNNYLLAWSEYSLNGERSEFHMQVLNREFKKVGPLLDLPAPYLYYKYIFTLEDGHFLTFWQSQLDQSYTFYAKYFFQKGEKSGITETINPNQKATQGYFVCKLLDDTFLCAWNDKNVNNVYGQLVSNEGKNIGEEFIIAAANPETNFIALFDMFTLKNGNVLIALREINSEHASIWSPETKTIIHQIPQFPEPRLRAFQLSLDDFLIYNYRPHSQLLFGQIYNSNGQPEGKQFSFKKPLYNFWSFNNFYMAYLGPEGINCDVAFQKYSKSGDLEGDENIYNFGYSLDLYKNGENNILGIHKKSFGWHGLDPRFLTISGLLIDPANLNMTRSFRIMPQQDRYETCPPLIFEDGDFTTLWSNGKSIWAKRFPKSPLDHDLDVFSTNYPANDETLDTTGPILSWQNASDQEIIYSFEIIYEILLDDSPDFISPDTSRVEGDTTFQWLNLERGKTYFWKVKAENVVGETVWSDTKAFYVSPTASNIDAKNEIEIPDQLKVLPNYPNPFNSHTVIPFVLPQNAMVSFDIYDVNGRLIFSDTEYLNSGEHSKRIELMDLSSGLYFLTVSDGHAVEHRKVVMIK